MLNVILYFFSTHWLLTYRISGKCFDIDFIHSRCRQFILSGDCYTLLKFYTWSISLYMSSQLPHLFKPLITILFSITTTSIGAVASEYNVTITTDFERRPLVGDEITIMCQVLSDRLSYPQPAWIGPDGNIVPSLASGMMNEPF